MRKKIVTALLLFSMIGMMTACGDTKQQENVENEAALEEGMEEDKNDSEDIEAEDAETEDGVEVTEESEVTEELGTEVAENSESEAKEEAETEPAEESETVTEEENNTEAQVCTLADLTGLLGMEDEKTADLFGGGEENWTEDRSFYIGRIYEINLFEETFPMFTSCDDQRIVNAVSIWLANGETEVVQETVDMWVERITEYAEVDPSYYEATSESGSKNWKWVFDGKIISLSWSGDTLSIGMHPAVGELK